MYWSPDEVLQASIIPVYLHEHAVEIRTKSGKLLFREDYSSSDHEHGRNIVHAQWSPDSRFFAYSTTSSGGHSAWHCTTFAYNRALNKVFDLDDLIGGPLVEAIFYFGPPSTFHSKRINPIGQENGTDEPPLPVDVALSTLKWE